jgi:hypothetical protein
MRTYDKRIAFLISDQHLIPHGGIGQFAKGFIEMCNSINWKVDLLLDKEPTNDFSTLMKELGANIITPNDPLRYSDHTATFAFTDSVNFEKVINFRKVILKSFESNIYDMVVCNTHEAMTSAHAMSIAQYIPVIFYTHSTYMIFREKQKFSDVFLDSYNEFYVKHAELNDIFVGTQSITNLNHLKTLGHTNAAYLPMAMTERDLLEPNLNERAGVLFIGRWEERKNPDAYLKVMKETGLPCKVMTNSSGAKKFEKAFNDAGITDYEIKAGIVGKEKSDFIKSAKVFFMPSQGESYGFAFLECLGHMPCIVLDTQDWSDNFDSKFFIKTSMKNAAETIQTQYNITVAEQYETGALQYVQWLDQCVSTEWIKLLDSFSGKRSNTNAAKINTYETVKYRDYIKELERKHLAREDFESVLGNKHKFVNITYTDNDSYLSKDPTYKPVEELTGVNLFDGL